MGRNGSCELCQLALELDAAGKLVRVNDHWTLNSFVGESNRPRWVLQSVSHVTSFDALGAAERASMGDAIAIASAKIGEQEGVEKVYVQSFNETAPGHLHLHLIPRYEGETKLGPELEDLDVLDSSTADSVLRSVADSLPKHEALPFVARASMAITGFWGRRFSAYRLLSRAGKKFGPFDAAELYVISWFWFLVLLLGLQMFLPLAGWASLVFGVFAVYRLIDIGTYVFGMLLSNRKTHLVGLSRSLILMLTNLLESALATALILNALGGTSWVNVSSAFSLMLGLELNTAGWSVLSFVAYVLGSAVFFICAVLALAIVVGKIGERFSSNN